MALYRNIQMDFWSDAKVVDDFTPEDKFFYLYMLTNAHTNLSGCYEISLKQMADEIGYSKDTIEKLIKRFTKEHKVILYSTETKELLLLNWYKYNWTNSEKFRKPLLKEIEKIKNISFKTYLMEIFEGNEDVDIPNLNNKHNAPNPVKSEDVVEVDNATSTTNSGTTDTADNSTSDVPVNSTTKVKNNNTKSNKSKKTVVYYPNDEMLNQAFCDFVEMRKQIKKPMTEKAIELAMKNLQKLAELPFGGMDNNLAIKIIEQSIMNSWQGLFPLRENNNKNANRGSAGGMGDINEQEWLEKWRNA